MIRSDDTSRDGGSRFLCVTADSEVSIIVRNSLFPQKFVEARAVIDTGADFSCIPTRMLPPLGFVAYHVLRVGDYDGIQRWKLAYYLTIEFFGRKRSPKLSNWRCVKRTPSMSRRSQLCRARLAHSIPPGPTKPRERG